MARPDRSPEIDAALLGAVAEHPSDLTVVVADQLGLSRQRINMRIRVLLHEDFLRKSGTTRPIYSLGAKRRLWKIYPLEGLAEDRVWHGDLLPLLNQLHASVLEIAHHGVTEMINNAIDHSAGQRVMLRMELDTKSLSIIVRDDGVGVFRKISQALDLPDERLALLELSKGKLTTDPRRHSGEGIFFTSRAFNRFRIVSHGLFFDHDSARDQDWLDEFDEASEIAGTTVAMQIALSSERTLKQVFDEFSSGPDDYDFAKTVVPVRLAKIGDEHLISRSQAKRLLHRIDRFRSVVLDFDQVSSIGQAFADEIFRVFANDHPEVELMHVHAAPEVQQMIRRAKVLRDEQDRQLRRLG